MNFGSIVHYQMHWICAAKISLPVGVLVTVVKFCLNTSLGNSLDDSGIENSCSILV